MCFMPHPGKAFLKVFRLFCYLDLSYCFGRLLSKLFTHTFMSCYKKRNEEAAPLLEHIFIKIN